MTKIWFEYFSNLIEIFENDINSALDNLKEKRGSYEKCKKII